MHTYLRNDCGDAAIVSKSLIVCTAIDVLIVVRHCWHTASARHCETPMQASCKPLDVDVVVMRVVGVTTMSASTVTNPFTNRSVHDNMSIIQACVRGRSRSCGWCLVVDGSTNRAIMDQVLERP